jgi:DHA1 family bicyclomycin/chloramphenicol resistance-like MFS transporter
VPISVELECVQGQQLAPAPPRITPTVLITLALLAAVAAIATDLYLPAFPQMAIALATGAAGVQLTLTTFLVGAAVGQLVFGPLSDRYGRMPPLVAGALVCAVASAAAALATNIESLVVARFVQGFAGSAGMVLGRAIISDLAEDARAAARAFSLIMTVIGIVPVLAPWLGSVLVGPLGWRGMLWIVFGITLLMLGAVLLSLKESHPARRRPHSRASSGLSLLLNRQFVGNTFAFGLGFAALMAYISASPFLFQMVIGLSVVQYGLAFGLIALMLTGASVAAAHLAGKVPARRQLRFGLLTLVGASFVLSGIVWFALPPIWTILPITVAVGSLGFVLGNAPALAIAAVPRVAGAGSAVLGALQFGLGALVAPLVGLRGERSAGPLVIVMTVASALALASALAAEPVRHEG